MDGTVNNATMSRLCDVEVAAEIYSKAKRITVFFFSFSLNHHVISAKYINLFQYKGLSQRVAYAYPTGVTLLHTSSPSSLRARFWAAARTRVRTEAPREAVAGRSVLRRGARLHKPGRRTEPGQEERPSAEPRFSGRGAAVVAW